MSVLALPLIRETLRESFRGGFLRRCDERDWLLVSDLPKRAPIGNAARLLEQACCTWELRGGLMFIGLSDALLSEPQDTSPPPFPGSDGLLPAYELLRLLCAHPSGGGSQPKPMIYDYLKAEELGISAALALAPSLCAGCAERLRLHQPLPTALIAPLRRLCTEGSKRA